MLQRSTHLACRTSTALRAAASALASPTAACFHTSTQREGDWTCPKCNTNCFAYRMTCFSCDAPRNDLENSKNFRAGDWICPECKNHCFASKSECFQCKTPRAMQHGDWNCDSCGMLNFKKRGKCFGCGNIRTTSLKKGDWICPECHQHNFSSRKNCMACMTECPSYDDNDDN